MASIKQKAPVSPARKSLQSASLANSKTASSANSYAELDSGAESAEVVAAPLLTRLVSEQTVPVAQRHTMVQRLAESGSYSNRQRKSLVEQAKSPKPTPSSTVQRFGSLEHQSLGNQATGSAQVNAGGTGATERFMLSQGDIVAMSGDYFMPEDLFKLGAIPGNKGAKASSRDEIIYVLHEINPQDSRFQAGGAWAGYNFSQGVKDTVTERYNKLAAKNNTHFVAPRGRDAAGNPLPGPAGEGNAGQSYRSYHEKALWQAYQAGQGQGELPQAQAMEAAAQHFLTDSFSAGHGRTPVGLIREYWGNRYPLFWYNLLHKMALDTANRMNDQGSWYNPVTGLATVQMMYEGIMEEIDKIAGSLPEITLGDLLSKVFHDYDNENGLAVAGGRIYGDDHLDDKNPQNITRQLAQQAIQAGNTDVQEAFNLGQGGQAGLSQAALGQAVRQANAVSGSSYRSETLIPKPDATNPPQNWQAASFEELWSKPVAGSSGATVGQKIIELLQPGAEMRKTLDDLATKFPKTQYAGALTPQSAYLEGFVEPLARDPKTGVLGIINWVPNYGLREVDQDDISLATGEELNKKGKLGGMTTPARVGYIRELIDGSVAGDEQDLVVKIFETAPSTQRPIIYQQIEGHAWKGDWIHGWTVTDDDIWDALSRPRLDKLRTLINAGR